MQKQLNGSTYCLGWTGYVLDPGEPRTIALDGSTTTRERGFEAALAKLIWPLVECRPTYCKGARRFV